MGRQQCMLLGNARQIYHVDANGGVWNRAEGGTAWKNQASYDRENGVWVYQGGSVLILIPTSNQFYSPQGVTSCEPPVLGLRPATNAVLEYDKARCKEIGEALLRYATAMQPIPQDWLDELSELVERNQPEMPTPESLH